MTNKEAMGNLSDAAFFDKWHWLTHVYGKGYTDSRIAIIEWLGREADDPDRVKVVRLVKDNPTIDAAPVKHGRWEGDETCDAYDVAGVKTWAVKRKCSACGFVHKFIEAHMCYEFCPNCGAKMDLEG